MCNQSVSISSTRLKLRINEDEYGCPVPTWYQCSDAYGLTLTICIAIIAICNYISPFQHSALYLMLMQLLVTLLLALSPFKNILCNYRQFELIFVSRD